MIAALDGAFGEFPVPVFAGATWATDAPFRETQSAIDAMCRRNLMAVEMETALYAFAHVRQKPVLCFAMSQIKWDASTAILKRAKRTAAMTRCN